MTVAKPLANADQVLLSKPARESDRNVQRLCSEGYENKSNQFRLGEGRKDYNRQYFEVYGARLAAMRPMIIAAAKKSLGENIQVKNLSDLREDDDEVTLSQQQEEVLIIGTVFKQQERKPSILKELSEPSEDGELELEPAHTKYTADTDSLVLEDETMRVKMEDTLGKMKPGDLVNGVVAGVWGREAKGGRFAVKEVFFSGLEKEQEAKNEDSSKIGAKSLCLMSGLQLGGEGGESLSAAQLAIDWLVGSAAGPEEQSAVAEVGRLVIAGDSLSDLTREKGEQNKALYLTVGSAAGSIAAVRQLDDLLVQAALTVAVDLMPGPQDPATCVLPQQPLHRLMFPQAGRLPTLQSVTNPYAFVMDGRKIIVTAGQTVADILRNSELPGPLEALERCLTWGHLAPTTPDTLGLFPYSDHDPHVLTSLPDILVAGNQEQFLSKQVDVNGHKVLLVCVPRFSSSQTLVRVNLASLVCDLVNFSVSVDM